MLRIFACAQDHLYQFVFLRVTGNCRDKVHPWAFSLCAHLSHPCPLPEPPLSPHAILQNQIFFQFSSSILLCGDQPFLYRPLMGIWIVSSLAIINNAVMSIFTSHSNSGSWLAMKEGHLAWACFLVAINCPSHLIVAILQLPVPNDCIEKETLVQTQTTAPYFSPHLGLLSPSGKTHHISCPYSHLSFSIAVRQFGL